MVLVALLTVCFVSGIMAGLAFAWACVKWPRPGAMNDGAVDSNRLMHPVNPVRHLNLNHLPLPEVIFVSRAGKCFHSSERCQSIMGKPGVQKLKMCEHCRGKDPVYRQSRSRSRPWKIEED